MKPNSTNIGFGPYVLAHTYCSISTTTPTPILAAASSLYQARKITQTSYNTMDETNWVIQVQDDLNNMADTSKEMDHWKKRSIYKVPACVTDLNKNAYKPHIVSFGPYHHGEEHLKPMEDHKHRALLHFLKRSEKTLEVFLNSLATVAQDIKDSYDSLDLSWQNDTSGFLKMIVLDGCFMLEILHTATQTMSDYASNDPIFSNHGKLYIMPYIRRDMLMLENQLPMLVLDKLLHVATENHHQNGEEFINKLILKFWSSAPQKQGMGTGLHVLDVYRKSLLQEDSSHKPHRRSSVAHEGEDEIIRSATELNESGIRFKKSKSGSLKDISFKGGVLRLPLVVVDDAMESMFLNLIAFERFHVGAGNEVTSYIFFMDNIIDNSKDVALLHSKGIIQNAMGSDKAVAKIFNSLSKDVTLDPNSSLDIVHQKVNHYCKKQWNEWRANLIHTYFRNPWAVLSVVAAILLFALTIAQTIYTIYPFYHQNDSPPSSPYPPPPSPPTRLPNKAPPR